MFKLFNTIICSYKNYGVLSKKFPKKTIHADRNCDDDWFYYFNKKGKMRWYATENGYLYDAVSGDVLHFMAKTEYKVKL